MDLAKAKHEADALMKMLDSIDKNGSFWKELRVILSAPVPPLNGAIEAIRQLDRLIAYVLHHYAGATTGHDRTKFERDLSSIGKGLRAEIVALSPSDAGVAEPDDVRSALEKRCLEFLLLDIKKRSRTTVIAAAEFADFVQSEVAALRSAPVSVPAHPFIEVPLTFLYKNHRDEVALRNVFPISVRFGTTEWHPEAQWLLRAFDRDKQAEREFAMRDINPLAAPPVGDRAAIVRIIHGDDEDFEDLKQATVSHGPRQKYRDQLAGIYAKADAILSLLVQSGVDERDICSYCDSEMEKDTCSSCGRERVPPEGYTRQLPHSSSDGEGSN